MKDETTLTALKSNPNFTVALSPSQELTEARQAFDAHTRAGNWGKQADDMMAKCVELAKAQYYPLVKSIACAALKDWKSSADAYNATEPQFLNDGRMTQDTLYRYVMGTIQPHLVDSPAYLNVANILKPAVAKALKDLVSACLVSVEKPRRSKWGAVCKYGWAIDPRFPEETVKTNKNWRPCEKCQKTTRLSVDVNGRDAAWCGCGN